MASREKTKREMKNYLPELDALFKEHTSEMTHAAQKTADEEIKPYRYFDVSSISKDLGITKQVEAEARKLIQTHDYRHFNVDMVYQHETYDEPDRSGQDMLGKATLIREYSSWAELVFSRDALVEAECNSWSCYSARRRMPASPVGHRLCCHEAAALFLLQDYLRDNNPGDATNRSGARLLQKSFSGDTAHAELTSADLSVQLQHLEPYVFVEDGNRLDACFRIGAGRLYKVKSITELVSHIRSGDEMAFGSSTKLRMGREYLDEKGRGWLELLEEAIDEEKMRAENLNSASFGMSRYYGEHGYDYTFKDRLPLFGARLDRFFALAKGSTVEFQFKDEFSGKRQKRQLLMRSGSLDLKLKLSAVMDRYGVYQGVRLSGSIPGLIKGASHTYLLENNALFQLEGEKDTDLYQLEQLTVDGDVDIRIGRNELRTFYHNYLPAIRRLAQIEEDPADRDLTARYLPPDASLICFLDADDGNVVCQPCAVYRDTYYSVTDLKPGSAQVFDPVRDLETEHRLLSLLDEYFDRFDAELKVMFTPREDEAVFRFLDEGLERLLEISEVRSTERFRRLGVRRKFKFSLGVSVESGIMDLDITSSELDRNELLNVLDSYRRKRRFVRLRSGDFLKLDDNDQVAKLTELMDSLQLKPREFVKGKMHIPAYRALYLDRMLEETEGIYADRDRSFKALIKQFKTIADSDFEVPETLRDVLRRYQKEGYRWLRTLDENHFGGILADDMGLGKTLQVISVLLAVRQESANETAQPSLIVCPASLVYNWGEELKKFAPQLSCALVAGAADERRQIIADAAQVDVLVTSYDLLKRDIDAYDDMTFRFEVIDEAQYIKNHTTAAAKAVKLIRAQTRFALTGTPIENRLSELWSIFDYLMPGFLYEYTAFRTDIETPVVKNDDEEVRARLSRMVSPFILRRLKADVLKDLPEKLEEVRYAGMDTEQRRLYDAQVVRMKQTLHSASEEEFRKQRIEILAELIRLRQICCDPSLCFENYKGGSAKREAVKDLLRGAVEGGHRILVFSQFVQMLELLEEDLKQEGTAYYMITGSTPKRRRVELVNAFNEGQVPVFLISLKAGGTGLNLTGADTVIHYDPWWNLAVQNQATDRAHRIGQKHVVTVYKMIMKGTIEEKIVELQETKKKLADDILAGESISSSTLSREDLLFMLE